MGPIKTNVNFNSDAQVHTEIPKQSKQDSPRIAQLKSLMSNIGIPIDNLSTIYSEAGGWKGLWKKLIGSEAFSVGLGEVAAYGAGELAEGVTGGFAGAIAGLAVEAASLFGKVTGSNIVPSFKTGEWVGIDNGSIRIAKKIKAGMAWTMGAMFEDFPEEEEEELETERMVSFGFVVGDSSVPGKVTVFNFEIGEKEDKLKFEVVALPREKQDLLDENEQMMTIKEIIINDNPTQAKKMRCEVPCDPGEEVTFEGKTFHVISCDGVFVRVTDGTRHYDLHMKSVGRGRVKHVNSWNYGAKTDSGFDSDARSRLFAGQWVWIAPRAMVTEMYGHSKKELAVIRVINGNVIQGYYALDGIRFDTHITQVHAVIQERQGFLDQEPSLKLFKSYAVKGSGNVRNFHASESMILICVGLGKFNKELLAPGHTKTMLDANLHHTELVEVYEDTQVVTPGKYMKDPMGLNPDQEDQQDASRRAERLGFTKGDALHVERQITANAAAEQWSVTPVTAGVVILGVIALYYASTIAT